MSQRYYVLLIPLLLGVLFFTYQEGKDEFRADNISPSHADHLSWDAPEVSKNPPDQLDSILSKNYHYLGKGHQSYAFLSDDQQYVLKFIKFTYLKPSLLAYYDSKYTQKGQLKRLKRVLTGYDLAYHLDQENTGVTYIHFQKTIDLQKQIQVSDRYGFKHAINLDDTYFIIQKKATVTSDVLSQLLKNEHVETAKKRIRQILDLYVSEYRKGLYDTDHNVMSNTGFIDDEAIRFDVGRLKLDPKMKNVQQFKSDLEKVSKERFQKWIKKRFPQYFDEIINDIENKVKEILDE